MASSELGCRLQPYAPLKVPVHDICASVALRSSGLVFKYQLEGDLSKLRIPALAISQHADNLWQQTCFEAFIRANDEDGYYELNFSPSRQWAVYGFSSYRVRRLYDGGGWTPVIVVRDEPKVLALEAVVPLQCLPSIQTSRALRMGLCAVAEASDGQLSYWAIKHPADRPDFHHPDSFALEFALRDQTA